VQKVTLVLVLGIFILCLIMVQPVIHTDNILTSGEHLKNAKVYMSMSKDTPWEALPAFVKYDLARGWSGNKLDKDDLCAIQEFIAKEIRDYVEPIGIAEDFEKDGKVKKTKED